MKTYEWTLYSQAGGAEKKLQGWDADHPDDAWTQVEETAAGWINKRLTEARNHLIHCKQSKGLTEEEAMQSLASLRVSGQMFLGWAREAGGASGIPGFVSRHDLSRMEYDFSEAGNPLNRNEARGYFIHADFKLIGRVRPTG